MIATFGLAWSRGREGAHTAEPTDRDHRPPRVEGEASLFFEVGAERGEKHVVGRPLDEQGVGADRKGANQLAAERRLQRQTCVLGVVEEGVTHPRAGAIAVLHRTHALEVRCRDHEGRVGGVDDLMRGGEPLVDESKHIPLRGGVQAEAGLVEEQNGALGAPQLGQGSEEGEEPGESLRSLAEVERDAVPLVADAYVDEGGIDDAMTVEIDIEVDGKQRVLAPVAKHLVAYLVGRGFQGSLAGIVVAGSEFREVHVGKAQQRQCGTLARGEGAFVVLQPGNGEASRHHAVLVEVQEPGEAPFENTPDAVEEFEIGIQARRVARTLERVHLARPPGRRTLSGFSRGSGVQGFRHSAGRRGAARGLLAFDLPAEFAFVIPGHADPPGSQHAASVHSLHRPQVFLFQLERGRDGRHAG